MQQLIHKLTNDYPALQFCAGKSFCWSPARQQIIYKSGGTAPRSKWALLHEVAHALLDHKQYSSDFELLKLEVAAWSKAQEIATAYDHTIDDDHIQNCLDTYRDWLHRRSTCPNCGNRSLQENPTKYRCFNCHTIWQVTTARFCRPYRQLDQTKQKSPVQNVQAIFS